MQGGKRTHKNTKTKENTHNTRAIHNSKHTKTEDHKKGAHKGTHNLKTDTQETRAYKKNKQAHKKMNQKYRTERTSTQYE